MNPLKSVCSGSLKPVRISSPSYLFLTACLAVGFLLGGCGGGNNDSDNDTPTPTASTVPSSVAVTAEQTELQRGQSTRLRWSTQNATALLDSNFGATELSGNKDVQPLETTTYTLNVRDVNGQTISGSTTVRVASVALTVSPTAAIVDVYRSQPFSASITGATDTRVLWSVDETGGGTVSDAGIYTAPGVAGTYHVRAQSRSDASKSVVIEVRVRAASGSIGVN